MFSQREQRKISKAMEEVYQEWAESAKLWREEKRREGLPGEVQDILKELGICK